VTELSPRRRLLILAICCCSLLLVSMDVTIVNVALPAIRGDLNTSVSGLQWVMDAYTLVLAALLILSGSTADRFGRRRTFQLGLAIFTLGSLLCSLSPNLQALVGFRIMQAVGGSMLNPVAMSIITNVFTDPRERGRAIGTWGAVIGVSFGLGPVVGGLLTEHVSWRATFWINVPIGIAAFILAALFVPESRGDGARRFDPLGQVLVIVVLIGVTYATIEAPRRGWSSVSIWGLMIVAAAALAAFIPHELRRRDPLIQLRFFRNLPFAGATLMAVLAFGGFGGFMLINSLYLQEVRGFSPVSAGLSTLPIAVLTLILAPVSGRLVGTRGPTISFAIAGITMSAAGVGLTRLTPHTSFWWLMICYILFGTGFGLMNAPITYAAVSGMPRAQAGVAAAIASTSRQTGSALGVAVLGSMVSTSLVAVHPGDFTAASHVAWWTVAGIYAAFFVVGITVSSPWARSRPNRSAHLFAADEQPRANAQASV